MLRLLRHAVPRSSARSRQSTGDTNFRSFGKGSVVARPAIITGAEYIEIGCDVVIGQRSFLSVVDEHLGRTYRPRLAIGDRTRIGRDAVIACIHDIEIGPDVLAADRIFIGDTYHDYRDPDRPILHQPMVAGRRTVIGEGAFLGIGSVVLPGVTVGEHAYVGAGAVVTSDVAPRTVVAGNPARVVRRWDEEAGAWRR